MSREKLIYFIKPVGMDGPIKIGCSNAPAKRLETLTIWSPFELEVLVTIPGGYKLETNIHQCFARSHKRGEWFEPSVRLSRLVDDLKNGIPIEKAIDLSQKEGAIRRAAKSENSRRLLSYGHRLRWAMKRLNDQAGDGSRYRIYHCDEILHHWRWGRRPSEEDIAYLEKALADPASYAEPRPPFRSAREAA